MDWKSYNWGGGTVLIFIQLAGLILVPWFLTTQQPPPGSILTTVILICACSLSITAGYHRLYSHRSYRAHPLIEVIILFFGSASVQGSALEWSDNHRAHHRFVDTEKDPYSVKRGFFHAHFLWMLKKQKTIERSSVSDLFRNPLTAFQHKHSVGLMIATNGILVLVFGNIFSSYLAAFTLLVIARLFITHHLTWCINSVAHYWGAQPYSKEHSAVNNFLISTLTFGEGYHNFHHTFEYDYRNGVRWYQWDPTKVLIWILHKLGLASHLRRANKVTIKRRLIREDARMLLTKTRTLHWDQWEELEKRIQMLAERLTKNLTSIGEKKERYRNAKKYHLSKTERKDSKQEIKVLKKSINRDYRAWADLCNTILS